MREAKLKAWVKERKIMADVLIINYKESTVQLPIETDVTDDYWWDETVWSFEEIELLQYTGLTDKNGKEIYEGDVISVINDTLQAEVIDEAPSFKLKWRDDFHVKRNTENKTIAWNAHIIYEVIGNIYEHPHLLEESK